MTMSLDVTVRLIDSLSAPARRTTESLDKLAGAARKLTNLPAATRDLRGLSTALRGFSEASAGGEATAGRVTRLANAVTGLAREAAGIKSASTDVSGMARSISRLAAVSDKAEKAAAGVKAFKGAFAGFPTAESFVERENVALRENLKLLRDAAAATNRLSSAGSGRGGRRGLAGAGHGGGGVLPGLMLGLQGHGGGELKSVYEQATSLQDAIVKMHLNGLSDSDIARVRAKAEEVAATNKSTNPLTNINAIMEARLALGGDLDEAISTAGEMAKLRTIVGFSLGKDRAKGAEDGVYDMLRTGEIRGLINDPARREELFKGMTAALIASNGRITPAQWHKTAIFGRSSTQGLSDQFEDYRLPFMMQELGGGKGGPAGTALQALFRAIPLATQKLSNIGEWRKLGLLDESKVDKDEKGHDKAIHPGAITLGALAITDPDKAVYKLMDAMKANGTTERGAMIQEFAQLVGSGTGQTAVDILGLQRGRMDNFERVLRQVEDSGTLFDQINATASQSVTNLNAQMDALKGNIGSSVIPMFTNLVNAAARFVGIADAGASITGGDGNDPVSGRGALSATELAIVGGGAAAGLTKLVTRFPMLGKIMAGGAATAAASSMTGNPVVGALLGPSIAAVATRYLGRVPAIATRFLGMLPETMRTGLGGLKGFMATALATDLIRNMPAVQHDERGHPYIKPVFDGDAWWAAHAPSWLGGSPTPIAGARAAGGPVGAGRTYLVGERGPEFFTPGGSGSITSNRMLARMASGGGDETAKSVRYLSFSLVSAVDGIARAVDRLSRGNVVFGGEDGGGDVSGAGTGSHISGGRRGFAERAGHFGGRRGFVTRQFGTKDESLSDSADTGPHVRLGTAGAAAAGRYAKFDSKAPVITGALMSKYGLTREQAAGVVGNLGHESAKFTAYHEGGQAPGRGGVGWAQWTGTRRRAFERWTAAHGLNPTSDEASWRFLTEGDPETAKAIAAVKRTHTSHDAVRAFHDSFERSADIAGGRIVKAGNWNSRLSLADRAYGMKPVAGVTDPADIAARKPTPADLIPDVLRDQAERRAREKTADAGGTAKGGDVHHHAPTAVTIHVHPQKGHSAADIAMMVHRKFNDASQAQYNDGVYA